MVLLELQLLLQELTQKSSSLDIQTSSNNSSISENNSNRNNLKITEVDVQSDSIIDDNDIPAFLRKRD